MKKLINFTTVLFLLLILIGGHAFALPSSEVYCKRVFAGFTVLSKVPRFSYLDCKKLARLRGWFTFIMDRERNLSSRYYQVVTAQNPRLIVYQIILKALYELRYQRKFDNYEFLRPYHDPTLIKELWQLFAEYPDLINTAYIKSVIADPNHPDRDKYLKHVDFDHVPEIRKQLIAACPSMENMQLGESAHYFFALGWNVSKISDEFLLLILREAFKLEGLESKQVDDCLKNLITLAPAASENGMIMQIFIPKGDIYNSMYVSSPYGFVNIEKTQNLKEFFAESEIQRDSYSFDPYADCQVRVLAGALDPDRVKIFRYTTIDHRIIKNYEGVVKKALSNLLR